MPAPGLDRARAWALARTLAALKGVDPNRLMETWWPASRVISDTIAEAQERAVREVTATLLQRMSDDIGISLGWDLDGLIQPSASPASVARRLNAVPGIVARQQAAGAEDVLAGARTYLTQLAGSVVHETARKGMAVATSALPTFSGWRWVPEGGACPWCRMQASRGAVFREDTVKHSHAHCRCDAVEVTDRAEARRIREDGREQWRAMLAAGDVPASQRRRALPSSPTSSLTAPGAGTPQRLVAVRAQIASYERHPATGERGRAWQRQKLGELRAELLTLAS